MTSHVTSYHAPYEESEELGYNQDWFDRNSLFPCDEDDEDDEDDESLDLPSRRMSRALAFQVLSEIDVTDHNKDTVLSWLVENNVVDKTTVLFASYIVNNVEEKKDSLDAQISLHATAWPLNQISVVDRSLLRMAFFEVLFDKATSYQVIINEAIELAKLFGSDNSAKFVNGVLGALLENEIIENLPNFEGR